MRNLIILFIGIFLTASSAYALNKSEVFDVTCYSGSNVIYHGIAKNFFYDDDFIMFTEVHTNEKVAIFANCVVKAK